MYEKLYYFLHMKNMPCLFIHKCVTNCCLNLGTTKVKNLDDNIAAANVKLSKEDLKEISAAVPAAEVAGSRVLGILEPYSWRVANTPPPK